MKNKKGALLFAPIMVVLMVVGLIYAWATIMGEYKKFDKRIGEKQFDLINTYQDGEKALFYIDQSAKYSTHQSIYDLSKVGGCYEELQYSGYTLWNVNEEASNPSQCNPDTESSKESFFDIFSINLDNYLSRYPVELIRDNYNLRLEDDYLRGSARNPLIIPIREKERHLDSPGTYSIKAPFKSSLDSYDFSDYEELKINAQDFIETCDGEVPRFCVDKEKTELIFNENNFEVRTCYGESKFFKLLRFRWDSGTRYSIYGFCVKSDSNEFYVYDGDVGTADLRNPNYKFALQFEDLSCSQDNIPSTQCKTGGISCSAYSSCSDTLFCYCPDPSEPGLGSACIGACLPFCSIIPGKTPVIDSDPSTKCKSRACRDYVSCTSASSCGCPDDLNACGGLNCDTLLCERDDDDNTKCRDLSCGSYTSCSSPESPSCECIDSNVCEGECPLCSKGGWREVGCGGRGEVCEGEMKVVRSTTPLGCAPGTGCREKEECELPPPPPPCKINGASCTGDPECCSNFCDETASFTCAPPSLSCTPFTCVGSEECSAYDENCNLVDSDDCCGVV